jgi:hypothetical protein
MAQRNPRDGGSSGGAGADRHAIADRLRGMGESSRANQLLEADDPSMIRVLIAEAEALLHNSNGSDLDHVGLRTRGVLMERVRPIRWLWTRRIPLGLPSLVVGEEGVGKGTVLAYLIARATRGELDGDQEGEPITVLVVGDEDGFESEWVPRIYTAGGDLDRLRTLDDGEYLDDLNARDADLAVTVERDGIGMIVLDQVLDHVSGGKDGSAVYNPKNVRQAMLPLRRIAGTYGIAAVGLLHPIKGRAGSFRELIAGSHQFNAVSRSSLLLGIDPDDDGRRVLVRGKGNHSAAPRSFEFRIGVRHFELSGHDFEMPMVEDAIEGDRTVEDLVKAKPEAPVRNALADQLAGILEAEPRRLARLAEAVGRGPKDGSVRNALEQLATEGRARKTDAGWVRAEIRGQVQVQPLSGVAPCTPRPAPGPDTGGGS